MFQPHFFGPYFFGHKSSVPKICSPRIFFNLIFLSLIFLDQKCFGPNFFFLPKFFLQGSYSSAGTRALPVGKIFEAKISRKDIPEISANLHVEGMNIRI